MLRRFLPAALRPTADLPAIPDGQRVYAIGDIHGRLDLLDTLLAEVRADDAARPPAHTHLILLGDLIDRGPDSAGVVARAMALREDWSSVHVLYGNHEEMLLKALQSERTEAMRVFVRNGGKETLLSYGISEQAYDAGSFEDVRALALSHIPPSHISFLETLPPSVEIGDYLFVHAGIRPGVSIAEQSPADMRWIREDFLSSRANHGKMVVHGHSIVPSVDERPNRIGIDTGAYSSGLLTALALQGTDRWFLATDEMSVEATGNDRNRRN